MRSQKGKTNQLNPILRQSVRQAKTQPCIQNKIDKPERNNQESEIAKTFIRAYGVQMREE